MSRRKLKTAHAAGKVITRSPKRMSGTPVFAGTRVPVKTLFDYLAAGDPLERFLEHFPDVSYEQAAAVLEQAGEALNRRGE
jgi:uncharacterized protein (DUF433 family)